MSNTAEISGGDHAAVVVRDAVGASIKRTVVPIIVAGIGTLAAKLGLDLDAGQSEAVAAWIETGIGAAIGAAWYIIPRLLEKRVPWVGVLLGSRKQPVAYASANTLRGAVVSVDVVPVDAQAAAERDAHRDTLGDDTEPVEGR